MTRPHIAILAAVVLLATSIAVGYMAHHDTPATSRIDTTRIQRGALQQRLRRVEYQAVKALSVCSEARSEAAMAQARAVWLRAMLHTMAHRHGRRLPRGLATWPKPAMKGME